MSTNSPRPAAVVRPLPRSGQARAATDHSPLPVVVEFVGLPGSGKSTVAERVLTAVRMRGVPCGDKWVITTGARVPNRLQRYARLAWFGATHLDLLAATGRHWVGLRPPHRERFYRATGPFHWAFRFATAPTNALAMILMHEGPVHDLWCSLLATDRHNPSALQHLVRRTVRCIPYPLVYVYVDVTIDVAIERVTTRSVTRLFNSTNAELSRRLLTTHGPALRPIFDAAREATRAPSIVVDGTRSPAAVAESIVAFLETAALLPPA